MRMYKTLIRIIMTYAGETRAIFYDISQDTHRRIESEMRNIWGTKHSTIDKAMKHEWNNYITIMGENVIVKTTRDNKPNKRRLP